MDRKKQQMLLMRSLKTMDLNISPVNKTPVDSTPYRHHTYNKNRRAIYPHAVSAALRHWFGTTQGSGPGEKMISWFCTLKIGLCNGALTGVENSVTGLL
jgi:hypothetical protein